MGWRALGQPPRTTVARAAPPPAHAAGVPVTPVEGIGTTPLTPRGTAEPPHVPTTPRATTPRTTTTLVEHPTREGSSPEPTSLVEGEFPPLQTSAQVVQGHSTPVTPRPPRSPHRTTTTPVERQLWVTIPPDPPVVRNVSPLGAAPQPQHDIPSPQPAAPQTASPSPRGTNQPVRVSGRFVQDAEGFLTHSRRTAPRRPHTVQGTRRGTTLRVAPNTTQVFVSNLHPNYSVAEMEGYVRELLGDENVTVEQPALKRTKSTAFVVTCHRRHYHTLMDGDSWEEDTRIRPCWAPRHRPSPTVPQPHSPTTLQPPTQGRPATAASV